ncbi:MAG: hypothetical protein LEGION0403_FIIPPAGN_02688 [Legionella sp.]|uniref:hypothetical protein n=1 Tax=Legionella sp. TaxID=459 RepID=UPI003D0DDDBD
MEFTIDDCKEHIIGKLQEGLKNNALHSTCLNWASYDVALDSCVNTFMLEMRIANPDDPTGYRDHQERLALIQTKSNLTNLFSEVLFELSRRRILRPGCRHGGHFTISQVRNLDEGFTITEYGKQWLKSHQSNLLSMEKGRLEESFSQFQPLFGKDYFKRTKEAVSCYFSGNYLACCVMCGAATESILLSAAFIKFDKAQVLNTYRTGSGRSRLEKSLFGQADQYIQDRYAKYTDLINYWRDESGHGDESEIDVHEAYIALLTFSHSAPSHLNFLN